MWPQSAAWSTHDGVLTMSWVCVVVWLTQPTGMSTVASLLPFDTTKAANDLENRSKVCTRNCQLTPVTVSEIWAPTGKGGAVTKAELRKQHHVARKPGLDTRHSRHLLLRHLLLPRATFSRVDDVFFVSVLRKESRWGARRGD